MNTKYIFFTDLPARCSGYLIIRASAFLSLDMLRCTLLVAKEPMYHILVSRLTVANRDRSVQRSPKIQRLIIDATSETSIVDAWHARDRSCL